MATGIWMNQGYLVIEPQILPDFPPLAHPFHFNSRKMLAGIKRTPVWKETADKLLVEKETERL